MRKADYLKRTARKPWRNPDRLRCPYCNSTQLGLNGKVRGKQRYFCRKCATSTVIPKGGRKKR